jgi:hypothetical protein
MVEKSEIKVQPEKEKRRINKGREGTAEREGGGEVVERIASGSVRRRVCQEFKILSTLLSHLFIRTRGLSDLRGRERDRTNNFFALLSLSLSLSLSLRG